MKKADADYVRITLRVDPVMLDTIKIMANKNQRSITDTVSRLLEHGVSCEMLADNSSNVTVTVGKMFREISRIDTDRLARLIIRTMKAAAAGMYLAAEAAGGTETKSKEVLDDALGMAVKYIKLPYGLPDAEEDGIKSAEQRTKEPEGGKEEYVLTDEDWANCNITDEELFKL